MRNTQAKIGEREYQELINVLIKTARDKDLFELFLTDLLTPNELNELVARWQIVKLLKWGTTQREVSKKLHVTLQTVARGATTLLNPRGGFNKILK